MEDLSYGNVLVCVNGHVVTAKANTDQIAEKYCANCGDTIINTCLDCGAFIKGIPRLPSQITPPFSYFGNPYIRQSYCTNCGKPYPWTKRAEAAAWELIDFANMLNPQEKEEWKATIPVLIKETPKTTVAVIKFRAFAEKAGIELGKAVKDIVVGVVSEVVKKAIT
ncbi:MAG TPA: DUF2321 domain-containing protein [Puia sp.]|jgi:hypothetical protein|nr:DUF2321 domain-containing protein [Puia sp.]